MLDPVLIMTVGPVCLLYFGMLLGPIYAELVDQPYFGLFDE